jgi:hypothetical protein
MSDPIRLNITISRALYAIIRNPEAVPEENAATVLYELNNAAVRAENLVGILRAACRVLVRRCPPAIGRRSMP